MTCNDKHQASFPESHGSILPFAKSILPTKAYASLMSPDEKRETLTAFQEGRL
jgi:hypothetical protein